MAVRIMVNLGGKKTPREIFENWGGMLNTFGDELADALASTRVETGKLMVGVGALTGMLVGSANAAKTLKDNLNKTAAATKAAKRILADFDEIRRLGTVTAKAGSGSGGTSGSVSDGEKLDAILTGMTDRLRDTVEWIRATSLDTVQQFFASLQAGTRNFTGAENLVNDMLARLSGSFQLWWNALWGQVGKAGSLLQERVIQPVLTGLSGMAGSVRMLLGQIGQEARELCAGIRTAAGNGYEGVRTLLGGAAAWFQTGVCLPITGQYTQMLATLTQLTARALAGIRGSLSEGVSRVQADVGQRLTALFAGLWENVILGSARAADGFQQAFTAAIFAVQASFTKAWDGVLRALSQGGNVFTDIRDGVLTVFKTVVNGLIRGLNSTLQVTFSGINQALQTIRQTEIQGQKPFAGLQNIDTPRIPYLARGAVLPANRPFLAVVGDQKRGTNIEAPLETIRQALALELAGRDDRAVTELLGQILQAVLGIQIGDEVIGRAADRYTRKMAVVRGGVV